MSSPSEDLVEQIAREDLVNEVANIISDGRREMQWDGIAGTCAVARKVVAHVLASTPIATMREENERLKSDGLPPGWHYTEPHTLLEEINAAAHTRGTNAWVRDVLHRAHREVSKSSQQTERIEKLEAALRDIIDRSEYRMSSKVIDDVVAKARAALETR